MLRILLIGTASPLLHYTSTRKDTGAPPPSFWFHLGKESCNWSTFSDSVQFHLNVHNLTRVSLRVLINDKEQPGSCLQLKEG